MFCGAKIDFTHSFKSVLSHRETDALKAVLLTRQHKIALGHFAYIYNMHIFRKKEDFLFSKTSLDTYRCLKNYDEVLCFLVQLGNTNRVIAVFIAVHLSGF